jgi:hypothetical protein
MAYLDALNRFQMVVPALVISLGLASMEFASSLVSDPAPAMQCAAEGSIRAVDDWVRDALIGAGYGVIMTGQPAGAIEGGLYGLALGYVVSTTGVLLECASDPGRSW